MRNLETFLTAYIEAALWCGVEDDTSLQPDEIAPETLTKMRDDCTSFWATIEPLIGDATADQAGHDFWFSRNRHGVGFWDRGDMYPDGDKLHELAIAYGEVDLYIGDDGLVYS
jgi:hypothetical protein